MVLFMAIIIDLNNQSYNGIVFGKFKCPIRGFDLDETECCDKASNKQFCCKHVVSFFYLSLLILFLALLFDFYSISNYYYLYIS